MKRNPWGFIQISSGGYQRDIRGEFKTDITKGVSERYQKGV
jgi:hypothetical protein